MKFDETKAALAQALYDLLAESNSQEWFPVDAIVKKSGLHIGVSLAHRVLAISVEDEEVFLIDDDGYWTLGRDGFDLIDSQETIASVGRDGVAPASDRVVRFNHNAQDAQEIYKRIEEVREGVRGANGPEINEEERERVYSALGVAQDLWLSGNLKVIQLKVGVLMAVEDAAALLFSTAKHVAAALLVDAIKSFAKNHLQIDLDAL